MLEQHILLSKVKTCFKQNIQKLKVGFKPVLNSLDGLVFKSEKLKNAASRTVVPSPFQTYVELVKKSNKYKGIDFPSNLKFTLDEVKESDREMINSFSIPNFDFSKLNLDYLILAGIQSAKDLGMLTGVKFGLCTPFESVDSFETSTSSGFPVFKKKGTEEARTDALNWASSFFLSPKLSGILTQPTAVFHRFQLKLSENLSSISKKIRPVWGVSFRVLVYEGIFFRKLIDEIALSNRSKILPVTVWGHTKGEYSDKIIKYIHSQNFQKLSVDVKQFDSNVSSYLWALFYAIIPHCIELPNKWRDHIDCLMAFGCFTPYCWNSTRLEFQKKGVPSGSLITSLFDTWVTRTVVNYAFLEYSNGKYYADNDSFCLGDDNIIILRRISSKHIYNVYQRFGLPISPEKSSLSDPGKPFRFLGYVWDLKCRPRESLQWYIGHLCLPSRFVVESDIPNYILQTYRGIGVCMGTWKGMEFFYDLVGYGDKVYLKLLEELSSGRDPIIRYIGEDQRLNKIGIPLSKILEEDFWRNS